MPTDPEEVFDPGSGEPTGAYSVTNDYGQTVVFDEQGTVLGVLENGEDLGVPAGLYAYDPESPNAVTELEPDLQEAEMAEYAEAEQLTHADLDERLDRLEQRIERPTIMIPGDPLDYDSERIAEALERQSETIEAELGRALTLGEKRALATETLDAVALGDGVDMEAARTRLEWEGRPGVKYDLGDDTSRAEFMVQRLRDSERMANRERVDDDLTGETPPPEQRVYDVDDDQQRQRAMALKLEGHDVEMTSFAGEDDAGSDAA